MCALAATSGALMVAAPAALAAAPAVADCNSHGYLSRQYSTAQLEQALSTMPADIKEYTDCYDVINRTLLSQQGTAHGGGGAPTQSSGGGSFLPTPVLVVLVLLALAAAALGALAIRRR